MSIPIAPCVDIAVWAKGVVLGNRAVGIQAKDFPVQAFEILAVASITGITCGHQHGVVGEPKQTAAVVNLRTGKGQQLLLVHQLSPVPLKHTQVLRNAVLTIAVNQPHPRVFREVRVLDHAQKPWFSRPVKCHI